MKTAMKVFAIAFVVIGLFTACKPEPAAEGEEENNSPTAVFAAVPEQFFVLSAGDAGANGLFVDSGEVVNGRAIYTNTTISYDVYIHFGNAGLMTGYDNQWVCRQTETYIMYVNADTSETVPESGWTFVSGVEPVPVVAYVDGISGINQPGEELAGEYEFSDEDEDEEGETTYQWLRCDSPDDEGTAIDGAAAVTYLLTDDDLTRYIRLQVIPVDDRGKEGDPVITEAFGPIVPVPLL